MRIKEISIKNFRQYQNTRIVFPKANKYDLNYILAENGIGKTTLLNAITWCLYGEEKHITRELKDKTLPLLTLKTLREMHGGDEDNTLVAITIEDEDGEIIFERSIIYRKTEEGEAYPKYSEQKVIKKPYGKEPEVLNSEDSFNATVNRYLPSKIQQFFFFDGEQLDTYLAKTAGNNVERTVLEISQIDLLVNMEKNLKTISDDLRRKAARSSSKSEEINKKYERKKKERVQLEEKYDELQTGLETAEFELQEVNLELGDDQDIEELERERKTLDDKLKNVLMEEEKTNILEIKSFQKRYMILLLALPRIRNLYDIIKEKEENKQLPPKYDKDELQQMLNEGCCHICNRKLDPDSMIFIAELLKRYELGHDTGTLLTRLIGVLEMLIDEASQYIKKRDQLYQINDRIKKDIAEANEKIRSLDSVIDKYTDKERIITLYKKRHDLEKYIKDTRSEVIRKEIEVENVKTDEKTLKQQLDEAIKKDKKAIELNRQKEFAENAKEKVSSIIKKIKGEIRSKISDEMCSKFFEFMWKKNFSKVELTKNYTASVTNVDGYECLGSCSAAERELLVLAFTLALHKESGFDGPLVIDTPISRISGDLRVAFAKVLRTVSENKQIILFVTEDEYSTNVRDIFEPYANRKYKFSLRDEDYVEVGEL